MVKVKIFENVKNNQLVVSLPRKKFKFKKKPLFLKINKEDFEYE